METLLAIIVVYFYGMGNPPQVKAEQVKDRAACEALIVVGRAAALKDPKVRDVQGGCMTIEIAAPRDAV